MKINLFLITLVVFFALPASALAVGNSSAQGQTKVKSTESGNSTNSNSIKNETNTQSQNSVNTDTQSGVLNSTKQDQDSRQNQTDSKQNQANSTQNQANSTQNQNQLDSIQNTNQLEEKIRNNNPDSGLMSEEQVKIKIESEVAKVKSQYSPRSLVAEQRMSSVASVVESLVRNSYLAGSANNGIGSQIRVFAQEQVKTHDMINKSLDKAEKRTSFAKFFIGPNFKELVNARQEMQQNQASIQELRELLTQITDPVYQLEINNQIQVLSEENLNLSEQLEKDAQGFSLFGWINKWANKY